jgi:carbon monoxide dehydrogenase subunit G
VKFSGSVDIAAPRDRVWAFVIDPHQVGRCGPGVDSVEVLDPTHFRATAKVGIGFIRARLAVDMEFVDQQPPDRARMTARGRGPGGVVEATASMQLTGPPAGPTRMSWSAAVELSGSLASLGTGMVEGTANKMIGQTFSCMKSRLEA